MRLLIVDDEKDLADALKEILGDAGYDCETCYDGNSAIEKVSEEVYDGMILDIMLPQKNGFEVLQTIRKQKIDIPILILSALNEIDDKLCGFDLGANDYMSKPFSTRELIARIKAMTKESTVDDLYLQYKDLLLSKKEETLSRKQVTFQLSKCEYMIMALLLKNEEHTIPMWRILEKVWKNAVDVKTNTVYLYVSYLNRKLKALRCDMYIHVDEENVKLCDKI